MAHSDLKIDEVRDAYVNSLLSTVVIAVKHGIPEGTIRRWKMAAKKTMNISSPHS